MRYRYALAGVLIAGAVAALTSIGVPGLTGASAGYGYGYGYGYQYQRAQLHVIKHVVNDNGGDAVASDWQITVTGGNPSPSSFPGAESPGTTVTIDGGTAYVVDETGPSGYALTKSGNCTGPIPAGGSATCTLENDDQPAHLIVVKHVINNNGGNASASDFTLTINGVTAQGGNSFPGAESPGTDKIVTPGSYRVTETGPSGYSTSRSAGCTGTIALGQTRRCLITNDDVARPTTRTLTVATTGTGTGNVTTNVNGDDGNPINCSRGPGGVQTGDCDDSYTFSIVPAVFNVQLTPSPAPDSSFAGWTGDCAGLGAFTVNMATGNKFCTAAFTSTASGGGAGGGAGGGVCDITGTPGPDTLIGGPGDEVICGLGGGDTIRGMGGDDIIKGGAGNDQAYGGPGDDELIGGLGSDKLYGRKGGDTLKGGMGADMLTGGKGGDTLAGGAGADILNGGKGVDSGNGGFGIDVCSSLEFEVSCP